MPTVLTLPQAGVSKGRSRKGVFPGKAELQQRWEDTTPPTRPGKPDFLPLPLTRFGEEGVQLQARCGNGVGAMAQGLRSHRAAGHWDPA